MITTTSTIAIAALIAGLGGAVSVFGGHETQDAPQPPVVQQATIGGGMCAIAATFSADPVMASQIRSAAGCPQVSPSR